MAKIFIGMETSGQMRRRLQAMGHWVVSCDILPAEDGADGATIFEGGFGGHWRGDVLEVLAACKRNGWHFDRALFHPTCTNFTGSAAWAYKDPDFDRYPGVGYHQRLKPGTLFGAARRQAREDDAAYVRQLAALDIEEIIFENPVGEMSNVLGDPSQIVNPYQFGDDASKKTCLWRLVRGVLVAKSPFLPIDPSKRVPGRLVPVEKAGVKHVDGWAKAPGGTMVTHVERWANQTDTGQNRMSPAADRWADRSRTYPGIADALAAYIGRKE